MAIIYPGQEQCGHCYEYVDSVQEDAICTECHVHSIGDMSRDECGCTDCEENAEFGVN
ncbi:MULTISPECIES: hypothetical protein [Streptomycetaceae]|uniref:Uncharacterized protein n=1 Tax=Streptantibioticus cattleyicolor (strain ATCC 35852 / DSM 46488 / JCM 4925 / NBRC 14057 / NRRL 8057) TaxID=1003195 RepID=F8JQY4_STREN|nr:MULTISPECIES: hypothetical protein [Streptomycetaceae]AEW94071.1 hypothetical protein SCATT_17000 [Streptantibioticus cattleyicolor NRRL 8057 = DSM 46488]CCB74422.1 protein of unknown function [Streptantibioticus cattleyicolor NRRL 8057 = DSM 46488]